MEIVICSEIVRLLLVRKGDHTGHKKEETRRFKKKKKVEKEEQRKVQKEKKPPPKEKASHTTSTSGMADVAPFITSTCSDNVEAHGSHDNKNDEGWKVVTRKRSKQPKLSNSAYSTTNLQIHVAKENAAANKMQYRASPMPNDAKNQPCSVGKTFAHPSQTSPNDGGFGLDQRNSESMTRPKPIGAERAWLSIHMRATQQLTPTGQQAAATQPFSDELHLHTDEWSQIPPAMMLSMYYSRLAPLEIRQDLWSHDNNASISTTFSSEGLF